MVLEAWRSFARATMAVLREAWMVVRMLLLLLLLCRVFNTKLQFCCSTHRRGAARGAHAHRTSSTGAAIAMDGGMADTACYYTGR